MIFTDSTAAMRRIANDAPGPSQEMAIHIIELARRIIDQGNTISVRWTPAHRGVDGNERADPAAKDAAFLPPLRSMRRHFSLAFLRRRASERATQSWRADIEERNAGRRAFRLPSARSRPGIHPQLARAPKRVVARFLQLLSGYALIAPFLKERWGWTESDACWWCGSGRQSRVHLFKECRTWKNEIGELWTAVGKASGERDKKGTSRAFKSRKGFGCDVRQAKARPSNTSIRDLLSGDRYTEAVLRSLGDTRVGEVKAGVICK